MITKAYNSQTLFKEIGQNILIIGTHVFSLQSNTKFGFNKHETYFEYNYLKLKFDLGLMRVGQKLRSSLDAHKMQMLSLFQDCVNVQFMVCKYEPLFHNLTKCRRLYTIMEKSHLFILFVIPYPRLVSSCVGFKMVAILKFIVTLYCKDTSS